MTEVRIPRENFDLPQQCIVCLQDCALQGGYIARYVPERKVSPALEKFTITFPLCATHLNGFRKGVRLGKISMILMMIAIPPFILGLVAFGISQSYILSIPFFVVGLICAAFGYSLLFPAGDLVKKNGKEIIRIACVTSEEIILQMDRPDLVELYKKAISKKKHRK